jgi:hypothetical protein
MTEWPRRRSYAISELSYCESSLSCACVVRRGWPFEAYDLSVLKIERRLPEPHGYLPDRADVRRALSAPEDGQVPRARCQPTRRSAHRARRCLPPTAGARSGRRTALVLAPLAHIPDRRFHPTRALAPKFRGTPACAIGSSGCFGQVPGSFGIHRNAACRRSPRRERSGGTTNRRLNRAIARPDTTSRSSPFVS